jgi:hypothetical protein
MLSASSIAAGSTHIIQMLADHAGRELRVAKHNAQHQFSRPVKYPDTRCCAKHKAQFRKIFPQPAEPLQPYILATHRNVLVRIAPVSFHH